MASDEHEERATPRVTSMRWRISAALAAGAAALIATPAAWAGPPTPLPEIAPADAPPYLEPVSPIAALPVDPMAELLTQIKPRIASLQARIQCVPFARQLSGLDLRGDASTWWAQAEGRYVRARMPAEGAVMVLRGYNSARRGHVAVVRRVVSERKIVIDHANWLNRGEITVDVPVEDVSPNGDWSQVRVWHVPGRAWGGRVYIAQGFIRPEAPAHASAGPPAPLS